ncbi:hypothetical protein Sros01_35750 [Streptomyces roseochromogenus]|nr:hypothetical protein Sros01_35750 [Streptomyces roseochromogenus]
MKPINRASTSHERAVEVLLADGTVPAPVYFDSGSRTVGQHVSRWSVNDGRPRIPQAAALRAARSSVPRDAGSAQ